VRHSFFERAWQQRDLTGAPITVYKMVPLPGIKHGNAEVHHMANKIFPNITAARARRPHRGFLYGLKLVSLSASFVGGMDEATLFGNRKDFDKRVHSDCRHWQRLGVDVNSLFSVVKNA